MLLLAGLDDGLDLVGLGLGLRGRGLGRLGGVRRARGEGEGDGGGARGGEGGHGGLADAGAAHEGVHGCTSPFGNVMGRPTGGRRRGVRVGRGFASSGPVSGSRTGSSRPVPALGSPVRRTHCGTLRRRDKCVTYYAASQTGGATRADGRRPRGRGAVRRLLTPAPCDVRPVRALTEPVTRWPPLVTLRRRASHSMKQHSHPPGPPGRPTRSPLTSGTASGTPAPRGRPRASGRW